MVRENFSCFIIWLGKVSSTSLGVQKKYPLLIWACIPDHYATLCSIKNLSQCFCSHKTCQHQKKTLSYFLVFEELYAIAGNVCLGILDSIMKRVYWEFNQEKFSPFLGKKARLFSENLKWIYILSLGSR